MIGSNSHVRFVPYAAVFDDSFEDMPRRVPDISKIRQLIGFEPRVQLAEIITKTAAVLAAAGCCHFRARSGNARVGSCSRQCPSCRSDEWSCAMTPRVVALFVMAWITGVTPLFCADGRLPRGGRRAARRYRLARRT